jgi:iron complex transport system substrate-binding protein
VLADARVGPAGVVDQLRTAGVPVVMVPEAFRVQDMAARITAVAAALGVPDAAEGLIARIPAVPTSPAEDDAPRVAFLYLRGTAAVYLLGGEGSGADALIAPPGHRRRPGAGPGLVHPADEARRSWPPTRTPSSS